MERASKLISRLRLPAETISPGELACTAWPLAVGKRIAGHTRASKLVRTRLVVEVEDDIWQRQLFALRPHIVSNLSKLLGGGFVEEVEFRVMPRRRGPQRAQASTGSLPLLDDANDIADPVLRNIYKASRKKALA